MWVYITGCMASVGLTWIISKTKYRKEIIWHRLLAAFLSALPLICIAGFRYNVGKDYESYRNIFIQIANGRIARDIEPLYYALNWILAFLGFDYTSVFVVTAILFLTFIFLTIYRDSSNRPLSVYLLVSTGYYFYFMNGMRQMLACAILLWALVYVKKKKFFPFIIMVIIATGFHYSSAVFILVYFIGNLRIKSNKVFVLAVAVFVFSTPLARFVNFLISNSFYSKYIGGIFDVEAKGYVTVLITAVILIFATVCYRDTPEYRLYYRIHAIAFAIAGFTGKVVLINRIFWFFFLPVIVLIPLALSKIKDRGLRICVTLEIVLLYGAYFFYTIGINNSNTVLPYDTIFNHIK